MADKEPWVFQDRKRVKAIMDDFAKIYPRGTISYHGYRMGWVNNDSTPADGSIDLICVDYSLQDIGGPDDVVIVFDETNTWEKVYEPNTLPPLTLLPRSQMVINARFIEGLTDDPR